MDEVQESPRFIHLLPFVEEEKPHWHLIAAGSLLEPVLQKEGIEFPVGRVTFMDLYPMTFMEFLQSRGEQGLVEYAANLSLNDTLPANFREVFRQYFYEYLMVGGMPEAVRLWQSKQDIRAVQKIYEDSLQAFREDLYKYSASAQVKYLDHVLMTVPQLGGSNAAYVQVGQNQFKTREVHKASDTLAKVRLLHKVPQTDSRKVPLQEKSQRKHKWLFADLGFCVHQQLNALDYILKPSKWEEQFRGRIMEQMAGQTLIGAKIVNREKLFYWAKPRHKGEAEIGFCYPLNDRMVGLEVKASAKKPAKALLSFLDEVENGLAVQSDPWQFGYCETKFAGKAYKVAYLPVYLLEFLGRYLGFD